MILNEFDIIALLTTFKLAFITTLTLLILGTPLAWFLARTKWRFKFFIEAIIAMPLILPPTVLGFYLLLAFGVEGPIGKITQFLGIQPLAFSFSGLVVGSVIYSLPFVVQPLQNAFEAVNQRAIEVAATLRASPIDRFFTVVVPLSRAGFYSAFVLGFAHTIGEFGVVLMIGGNIVGETQVVSIAIYDHVESLEYANANLLSILMLIISFLLLVTIYASNKRFKLKFYE